MAQNKTMKNDGSVDDYLSSVANERRREDAFTVLKLMKKVTGEEPKMWGSALIGFGEYHYQYESGREGDFFLTGFAPRKQNLVVYIMPGFEHYDALLERLGKHKIGKSCLYINKLADVDLEVLGELVQRSMAHMEATHKS
jgi:hypothetical protein